MSHYHIEIYSPLTSPFHPSTTLPASRRRKDPCYSHLAAFKVVIIKLRRWSTSGFLSSSIASTTHHHVSIRQELLPEFLSPNSSIAVAKKLGPTTASRRSSRRLQNAKPTSAHTDTRICNLHWLLIPIWPSRHKLAIVYAIYGSDGVAA